MPKETKTTRKSAKKDGGKKPVIEGIQRVSSPGLRRYYGSTEVPRVRGLADDATATAETAAAPVVEEVSIKQSATREGEKKEFATLVDKEISNFENLESRMNPEQREAASWVPPPS